MDFITMQSTVTFASGGNAGKGFQYRTTKRAAPTITPYEPSTLGRAGIATDFAVGAGGTTCNVANPTENGFRWYAAATSANAVLSIGVHFVIDARL
jgi:hypothetical protein